MAKRPRPDIEIVLVGKGIAPSIVPFAAISSMINAVQRLSLNEDASDEIEESESECVDDNSGALSLVGIRTGSVVCPCVSGAPESTIRNLRLVGKVLENPSEAERLPAALGAIKELSQIAKRRGGEIIVRIPRTASRRAEILATITSTSYEQVSREALIVGETTITGIIERAGGSEAQKCALRVPGRHRLLYCSVEGQDVNLVKRLGKELYETVTVSGTATWLRTNWKILRFTVREMHEMPHLKFESLAKELRRIGGKGWGKVKDVQVHMESISGEA